MTVDPIVEFIVEDGISIGCKMVIVGLSYPDPQNYKVTVGGYPLIYDEIEVKGKKQFYFFNDVPEGSVSRSNVKVTRK